MNYQTIRKQQYEYHSDPQFRDMNDFRKSPYTFLKHRFNMEMAAILVYLLQNTGIHPNFITYTYGAFGVIGGVLLALNKWVFLALGLFFTRGILDWADGHYARFTKQVSLAGADLDRICGTLGTICFYIGLGFYIINKIHIIYKPLFFVIYFPFIYLIKNKLPIGRARVIDFILFIVGLHVLLT